MSFAELLPIVRSLPRIEKLQLIQLLADDLVQSDESTPLMAGRAYPLWSPDRAYEAADTLLRELEAERTGP
jgi:hypothetical protein